MIKKAKLKIASNDWSERYIGDFVDFYLLEGEDGRGLAWIPAQSKECRSGFTMVVKYDGYWIEQHPNVYMNLTDQQDKLMKISLEMWEKSNSIDIGQAESVLSVMRLFQKFNG